MLCEIGRGDADGQNGFDRGENGSRNTFVVTKTCRALALPGAGVDEDLLAEMMASLEVDWQT